VVSSRFGKPTTAGWVVLAIIVILVGGVVLGVSIGGGTGETIDAVGGFLIVLFIFLMFGTSSVPRPPGEDPRDENLQPPGPTGLH
jgi:hypothetical protein